MDRSAVKAYEAAELRAYAALSSDASLADHARVIESGQTVDPAGPDDATVRAAVMADPVSAAGLGWITFPDLLAVVRERPGDYLDPDEAAAFAEDETALRLVVLARVDGLPFATVQAEHGSDGYALAARGDEQGARRVWTMLDDQGLLSGGDRPPPGDSGS